MALPRKLLILTFFVLVGACAFQEGVQGRRKSDSARETMKAFRQLAQQAAGDTSLINPFRIIARIILFATAPLRFVLRLAITVVSVVVLNILGCEIFPNTDCDFITIKEQIPELISFVREDLKFFLSIAK